MAIERTHMLKGFQEQITMTQTKGCSCWIVVTMPLTSVLTSADVKPAVLPRGLTKPIVWNRAVSDSTLQN